jgi:hypothetical protein
MSTHHIRLLAVAAVLLATPAYANSAAEWDCGNEATATLNKGFLSFSTSLGSQYGAKGTFPDRGTHRPNWRWDLRGDRVKVWLNGKLCKQVN